MCDQHDRPRPQDQPNLPGRYDPLTPETFTALALALTGGDPVALVITGLDVNRIATDDPCVEPDLPSDPAGRTRRVAELTEWVCSTSAMPCCYIAHAIIEPHDGEPFAFAWITEVTGRQPYRPPTPGQ